LTGGEALLHPDICDIIKLARNYFPTAQLDIQTNGLKLKSMPEEFYKTCKDNDCGIELTNYPANIDFDFNKLAGEHGLRLNSFGGEVKSMYKIPLNKNGVNPGLNFRKCHRANICLKVIEGKAYGCNPTANIDIFNKHFNESFALSDEDFVNIYSIDDSNKLSRFLSQPVPFCRHCDMKNAEFGKKWTASKKNKTEWAR
jgi:MoaA/NifB/PqqE/SkfB family radical SAM enzyme